MAKSKSPGYGKPETPATPSASCAPFYNPKDPEAERHAWETHGRLAQAIFSLGVGAGPIRITSAVILGYHDRFWQMFFNQTSEAKRRGWMDAHDVLNHGGKDSDYKNETAQVLDLPRSVG